MQNILTEISALSSVQQRQIYTIIGALVADAAIMPCHWVYDINKLVELKQNSQKELEFYPEPQCGYYQIPTGRHTNHGDACIANIESLLEGNTVDVSKKYLYEKITSDGSEYMIAQQMKSSKQYPIKGPWLMGAYLQFKDNYENNRSPTGSSETRDQDGFVSSFASIVKELSKKEFEAKQVEQYIRIVSNSDISVKYGLLEGQILYNIIQGKTMQEAIQINDYDIQEVVQKSSNNNVEVTQQFGQACSNPGNFKSALHALINSIDYQSGIRTTLMSGGENAARGFFVGACLGGLYGVGGSHGIPLEWIEKTNSLEKTLPQLLKIFKQ